jgi:putative sigma-54 modulation protein
MQLQVTGHHVEVTAGLKAFIAGKLAKLEEAFPKVRKVAVILSVEKYRHTAEIHFRADGVELSAKKTTKDMYASVEEAVAALEQQAGKRKDRLHTSGALRRGAIKVERKAGEAAKARALSEPAPKRAKVVKVKALAAKSRSLDEAVDVLLDTNAPWLLFRDEVSGATNLLFRRDDGSLGLAEG